MRWLRKGGAESNTIKLVNHLAMNNKVELLVLSNEYTDLLPSIYKNVNVSIGFNWRSIIARASALTEGDTIFCGDHKIAAIIALFRKITFFKKYKLGFRCINNMSILLSDKGWLFRVLAMKAFSSVDFIISQCEAMKEDLVENWKVPADNINVIYNTVSVSRDFHEKSNTSDSKSFLFVGRFSKQKQLDFLVNAFLKADIPNGTLTLVGYRDNMAEDRVILKNINRIVDDNNAHHKIKIENWTTDSSDFFNHHDFFLLSSSYEGFPNVLIEAIAKGLAIVSTDCSFGPSEIIDDDNGILVTDNSIDAYSQAISFVSQKKWDRKLIVDNAMKFDDSTQLSKIDLVIQSA